MKWINTAVEQVEFADDRFIGGKSHEKMSVAYIQVRRVHDKNNIQKHLVSLFA